MGETTVHLGIIGSAFPLVVLLIQHISFGLQGPERLGPRYVFIQVVVVCFHEQDGTQLIH